MSAADSVLALATVSGAVTVATILGTLEVLARRRDASPTRHRARFSAITGPLAAIAIVIVLGLILSINVKSRTFTDQESGGSGTSTVVSTSSAPTSPADGSTPVPIPNNDTTAASAVLNAINTAREGAGLKPLKADPRLTKSALAHCIRMSAANELTHQTSSEPSIGARVSAVGVPWIWLGENVAFTQGSDVNDATNKALGLESEMLNEAEPNNGHRLNILSSKYSIAGVGIFRDVRHNKVWFTVDFAGF